MKLAVVCVDDEKIVLDALKEQLRRALDADIQIETAESGESGLEVIEELIEDGYEVALIVCDQIMPHSAR